jgi:quercetin dioxygenase-like cupin family protein
MMNSRAAFSISTFLLLIVQIGGCNVGTKQPPEVTPQQRAPSGASSRVVLLENEQVLVVESTYPVRGGVPMHTHRFPHVLYVIEGGVVEAAAPGGAVEMAELSAGQAYWRPAQTHASRNIGPTPVRIVEIEVKGAPARIAGPETPRVAIPTDFEWIPDPLDPTRMMARLEGDPTQPGPYLVRVRAGAGYHLGLHLQPTEDERLTVLSGALHWSTGAAGSGASEQVAPAGSYLVFPAGTPHRLWATEETVLQMTGVGPRSYRCLVPADDPRAASSETAAHAGAGTGLAPRGRF